MPAHRLAYALVYGPVPVELYVCHECNVKRCVRPSHLYLATARQNTLDALRDGLMPHGESHGMARLTLKQVRWVRRMYNIGELSTVGLAEKLGTTHGVISNILRGVTWAFDLQTDGHADRRVSSFAPRRKIDPERKLLAAQLYLGGLRAAEVAEELDESEGLVKTWLRDVGARKDRWAKPDELVLAERLYWAGVSTNEIGRRLARSQGTIKYWVFIHGWKRRKADR